MGIATQSVATCDAPGCRKQAVAPNDVLPTSWVEGTVRDTTDQQVGWIACGDGHIKPAVLLAARGRSNLNANTASTNNVNDDPEKD